jgi:hypothetical protein
MHREAEKTPQARKIVIILPDRSREIIRLFEELQRKRQQVGRGSVETTLQTTLGGKPLIVGALVFSIGLAAMAIAQFIRPTQPEKPAVTVAVQEPVRVVGPAFVPNVNPRER